MTLRLDTNDRVIQVANFMIRNQATIRQAASEFGVSATTISHDLHKRLPSLDPELSERVHRVIRHNTEIRAYRGGEALRKKYRNKKKKNTEL